MTDVDEMKAYFRRRYSGIPAVQATTTQAGTVISPGSDLTATITHAVVVSAALDALGDMEAAVTHGESAAGLLDGIGDMTASITHEVAVAADLTQDSSDMQADITHEVTVAATLDGIGDMTAAITDTQSASAELDAVGDMTAAITHGIAVDATLDDGTAASLITANRVLHWDASDGSNTVSSGEITVLADLSGTGNDGTPLSGDVGAELLTADQNGLDVASYNGTDESNAKASPTSMPERTDNRTVYWVGRAPDTGSDIFCFVYGTNGTHLGWVMIMDQNTPDKMLLNIINETHDSTSDSFDAWAVWAVQYDDTAGVDIVRFYKNGVAVGTSSPTNMFTSTSPALAAVGANIAEGNSPQKFGEAIVYSVAHDSSELSQMANYLGAKWGITIP